jgi:hypothetical protein
MNLIKSISQQLNQFLTPITNPVTMTAQVRYHDRHLLSKFHGVPLWGRHHYMELEWCQKIDSFWS